MAKAKIETRGRHTALENLESSLSSGATMPLEAVPIPKELKETLAGRDTLTILRAAAPHAAQYLLNCLILRRFKPSWARIDVAKYIVDQVIGKAKIRAEITGAGGAPLTWAGALALFGPALEDAERLAREGKTTRLPQVIDVEADPAKEEAAKEEAPAAETAEA